MTLPTPSLHRLHKSLSLFPEKPTFFKMQNSWHRSTLYIHIERENQPYLYIHIYIDLERIYKMGLRDIGHTLPPGFRFYPSDEELVCHYLYKKIANEQLVRGTLVEIDLHTCEPWQLPGRFYLIYFFPYLFFFSVNLISW